MITPETAKQMTDGQLVDNIAGLVNLQQLPLAAATALLVADVLWVLRRERAGRQIAGFQS